MLGSERVKVVGLQVRAPHDYPLTFCRATPVDTQAEQHHAKHPGGLSLTGGQPAISPHLGARALAVRHPPPLDCDAELRTGQSQAAGLASHPTGERMT